MCTTVDTPGLLDGDRPTGRPPGEEKPLQDASDQ
jgi:hypothetical protein